MKAKSGGSLSLAKLQGPSSPGDENQRPETSRKNRPLDGSRNKTALVFLTLCSPVPGTGANWGGPVVTMISAGFALTKIAGATADFFGGTALRTAAKLASAGRA